MRRPSSKIEKSTSDHPPWIISCKWTDFRWNFGHLCACYRFSLSFLRSRPLPSMAPTPSNSSPSIAPPPSIVSPSMATPSTTPPPRISKLDKILFDNQQWMEIVDCVKGWFACSSFDFCIPSQVQYCGRQLSMIEQYRLYSCRLPSLRTKMSSLIVFAV